MTIEANVEAREAAGAVTNLIAGEALEQKSCNQFYRCLLKDLRQLVPTSLWPETTIERDLPMADDEARAFGCQPMEFGKWALRPIKDVPMDYLVWLETQPDFRRQLNRYLRNPQVQREQGDCEEEESR